MRCVKLSAILACFVVAGCAEHQTVVDPNAVSLEQAMADTQEALIAAHRRSIESGTNFQLYACTVTETYNISATGTVDNKIAVGASGGPPAAVAPVSVNINASHEATESGTRGNTVTVVLATPWCFPDGGGAAAAKKAVKPAKAGNPPAKGDAAKPGDPQKAGAHGAGYALPDPTSRVMELRKKLAVPQ